MRRTVWRFMTPAQSIGLLLFVGLPLLMLAGSIAWTAPGPHERRHRNFVIGAAVGLLLLAIAILIGGGVLEHVNETPESKENQFGAGWAFLALTVTLPVIMLSLAMFGVAITAGLPVVARFLVSIAAAVPLGGLLWWALVWMTLIQMEKRHWI